MSRFYSLDQPWKMIPSARHPQATMNQEQQQQGDFEASQNHTPIQHAPTNTVVDQISIFSWFHSKTFCRVLS